MKKEVGNNLMKQLDKMFNDVYRNDSMHYQHQTMRSGTVMKVQSLCYKIVYVPIKQLASSPFCSV